MLRRMYSFSFFLALGNNMGDDCSKSPWKSGFDEERRGGKSTEGNARLSGSIVRLPVGKTAVASETPRSANDLRRRKTVVS